MKKFIFIMILLSFMLAACGGTKGDPDNGRGLFEQETIGSADAPGCTACHSVQAGVNIVGPSLFDAPNRAQLTIESAAYTGSATSVDEYLRESISQPNVFIVEGYPADIMYPKYTDDLAEEQIDDLVAFLETL